MMTVPNIIFLLFFALYQIVSSQLATNIKNSNNDTQIVQSSIRIPPIYVLNLDRATQRWESISKVLSSEGLNYKRLSAVDGRKLSPTELKKNSTLLAQILQPPGVIGCYLSHRIFWQTVVDNNYESAIIFEDDVELTPNFKPIFEGLLHNVTRDKIEYDVIFLGAIGMVSPENKHSRCAKGFSAYMGGNRPFKRINDYLYQPVRPAGTHAYMVSLEGAKKLLKLCPKACYHVDLDAFRHRSLRLYMFKPILAFQTFGTTSLTEISHTKGLLGRMKQTKIFKNIENRINDRYTHQTLTHVLEEPMLQLTTKGPVLTVERHMFIVFIGTVTSAFLRLIGLKTLAYHVFMSMAAFTIAVKTTIWLLMHWK